MANEPNSSLTPPEISPDWALFLDVDGCLLEHAPSPELSRVPPELGPRLRQLSQRLDGALALVSGRSLAALDRLFPECAQICMAGLHGLEWRDRGSAQASPPACAEFEELQAQAQELLRTYPSAWIEAAGPCLNLHWRADPKAAPAMTEFADAAVARLPGYRAHPGAHGIEIRPAGIDKGQAIAALMARPPFAGRRPVFAGDDPADECGFAEVNARDGISVLVGERSDTLAQYRLTDPPQVRQWLGATREVD